MDSRRITKVHIIASVILWLLGLLSFVSAFWGTWEIYHLAGFTFLGVLWITAVIALLAFGTLHLEKDAKIKKKYFIRNLICLLLNIVIVVFTYNYL